MVNDDFCSKVYKLASEFSCGLILFCVNVHYSMR